jgi:hypothetical protein
VTNVGQTVKVEVLYFEGCPHHPDLLARLPELIERAGLGAEVEQRAVEDDAAAQRERFLGSPTVRINGRDIEPGADERRGYGLECRLYRSNDRVCGMPDDELITVALAEAVATGKGS